MNMDESWWMKWICTEASPEERELVENIERYGTEYFQDMLFASGTSSGKLISCMCKSQGEEGWRMTEMSLPEELEYFSYTYFHYKVDAAVTDCDGYFNSNEQLLCLSPNCINEKSTILHEMIHLHEFVINNLPLYFHDALLWSLYVNLKAKVPELDEIITNHTHILNESNLYENGGLHDILFLLKSFDLDIRCNWKLGTVFAYGRNEAFQNYSYVAG